jgi:hypothetical protein
MLVERNALVKRADLSDSLVALTSVRDRDGIVYRGIILSVRAMSTSQR